MRFSKVIVALAIVTLGGAAACTRTSAKTAGGAAVPKEATTLKVDNQGFLDMNVYVTRSEAGQRIRLGTATASSTTRMKIPDNILFGSNTSLRFIADPIGGRRASVSSSIMVSPGDEVTLQIPPG